MFLYKKMERKWRNILGVKPQKEESADWKLFQTGFLTDKFLDSVYSP